MPRYFGALALAVLIVTVLSRVFLMRRKGIEAMNFGKIDKKDFLIPPFALFYIYMVFAAAFGLAAPSDQEFFHSDFLSWVGVVFCLAGILLMFWSLVSFRESFRVGIDADRPGKLITTGVFAISRNPIYVAFGLVLLGEFLIFPNWILLVYIGAGAFVIHRQVLREEDYLKSHYGEEYLEYSRRVRRYL